MGAPGDDIGTISKGCDLRVLLLIAGGGVDAELGGIGGAVSGEGAGVDAPGAAISLIVLPGGDVAAIGQGCNGRFVLAGISECRVIETGFTTELGAGAGETLGVDVPAGATGLIRLIGNQITAVVENSDGGRVLLIAGGGVNKSLVSSFGASGVVALGVDAQEEPSWAWDIQETRNPPSASAATSGSS